MDEIILQNKEGQILASSREVAERFGKKHSEIIYAIEGREAWDKKKNEKIIKNNGLLMSGNSQLLKMFIKSDTLRSTDRDSRYKIFL